MASSPSPLPQQPQTKLPWSLTCGCWTCILAGVVPAAALWALNNRRLGVMPPLLTRVLIGASLALYLLVVGRLLLVEEGSPLMYRLQVVSCVMTLIVAWQLYISQRGASAHYYKTGRKTASLKWPFALAFIWVGVVVGATVGVETVRSNRDYQEFERFADSMGKSAASRREAERFFQEFKQKYPEETMTRWNLAIIYAETERVKQAKEELQEILTLEPDNKETRDFLRELEDY